MNRSRRRPARYARAVSSRVLSLERLEDRTLLATIASFDNDRVSAAYAISKEGSDPGPFEITGGVIPGSRAEYLRVYSGVTNNLNSISFGRTDAGAYGLIVADFDFRLTPVVDRPDGLALVLLNTANYGTSGLGPAGGSEPRYAGSLGIGFDTYHNEEDPSGDTIKVFYDTQLVAQMDVSHLLDMSGGQWIHARVSVNSGNLTLQLTPSAGETRTIFSGLPIPGYAPYESRVMFTGWSGGGAWGDCDLDNVNVQYMPPARAMFSLAPRTATVDETAGSVKLTVERGGDLAKTVSVKYATQQFSAVAGQDFTSVSGTLTFGPGIRSKVISVPILNDGKFEGHEQFVLTLSGPSAGSILAGPERKAITIVDDERGRSVGDFSDVLPLPNEMIHAILLPTYEVLSFDQETGHDNGWLWNPLTGQSRETSPPPAGSHLFCTGHTLLFDGRVFLAGGHEGFDESGHPRGLCTVNIYNPWSDTWESLPDMAHCRWYPTVLELPSGDVLLMGGYDETGTNTVSRQIEIYHREAGAWTRRDLDVSQDLEENDAAHDGLLYPRMYLAPDGRIFVLGAGSQTWWLNLAAEGTPDVWTPGPATIGAYTRDDYGNATMIAPGKILLVGGGGDLEGDLPQAGVELIDLNVANPQWQSLDSLPGGGRRHVNSTTLPAGDVLVTGGTRAGTFNDAAGDARQALHLRPASPAGSQWDAWDSAASPRLYHATALLLPSGKVLTAGSGQPHADGSWDQRNAEVFSPTYVYQNGRPQINSSPGTANYGQQVAVKVNTTALSQVVLMKLGSVTHSLEENARRVPLTWSYGGTGTINVNMPTNMNAATPGHYLLFILDSRGVPSEGRMIQLLRTPGSFGAEGESDGPAAMMTFTAPGSAPISQGSRPKQSPLPNSSSPPSIPPPADLSTANTASKENRIDRIMAETEAKESDFFIGPFPLAKRKR